jgi:hypothetical protein
MVRVAYSFKRGGDTCVIDSSKQIAYFKKIAENQYATKIMSDYGVEQQANLILLTESITEIYRHLPYNSFSSVVIYVAISSESDLVDIKAVEPVLLSNYENLSSIAGERVVIQVKQNGDLMYAIYAIETDIDLERLRKAAIIYHFNKDTEEEVFYGLHDTARLLPIPDADSYFAIQTYKNLESALEDYSSKVARHSACPHLERSWITDKRIFFKSKPEHLMRDSLTFFLKLRLRNTEIRPEQNVDTSHPVDIKVTWNFTTHLALIEIKWLGKSTNAIGTPFTSQYGASRALDGAQQLSDYLDSNVAYSPVKTTRGYLVVFDARRKGCGINTTQVNLVNGLHYAGIEIQYNPEFHKIRKDFAKPVRFFLEPVVTI